jgi:MmyB-like transcription regulator ligand binding domain
VIRNAGLGEFLRSRRARPATYRLMELLAEAPAILLGRRTDILAVNDAARAVFTNFNALPARERNAARWILLDPDARRVHGQEWETVATQQVQRPRERLAAALGGARKAAAI